MVNWNFIYNDRLTDKQKILIINNLNISEDRKQRYLKNFKKMNEEENEAIEKYPDSTDFQNIKNKLGLSQGEPDSRVIQELRRLKDKSDATWNAIGLNKKETLKRYNIS